VIEILPLYACRVVLSGPESRHHNKQGSTVLTLPTPGRPSSTMLLEGCAAKEGLLALLVLVLSRPLAAARMVLSTSANKSATPAWVGTGMEAQGHIRPQVVALALWQMPPSDAHDWPINRVSTSPPLAVNHWVCEARLVGDSAQCQPQPPGMQSPGTCLPTM
jgi:hypothetical protein